MEVSPNWYVSCSLFPFVHEYNDFQFNKSGPNYQKITELRHKLNTSSSKLSDKERMKLINKMLYEREDIQVFHTIVQLVDKSKANYKRKAKKKWQRISEILNNNRNFSKVYSYSDCSNNFMRWSSWYAQVHFQ